MILSYVASAVGRAFDTDALAAAKKNKISFARVCVEMIAFDIDHIII
jgi:hypothetical protein